MLIFFKGKCQFWHIIPKFCQEIILYGTALWLINHRNFQSLGTKLWLKNKKSKQNASLYLTSRFFCSSKMLNNRQFYWMGIIVWVLTIWSSRKIDLLPYRLACFSWVKNNDSINQKLFSYLPVAYLVHLDGMEIYLGMPQHTGGKINFGK